MPELRRRFCDQGWRFACNGVVFTGASSVAVTRYRYRGSTIPTPWTPAPARPRLMTGGQDTRSARCVETRDAAGGPGKPTGSNPGRAQRSDPTRAFYRSALLPLLRRINSCLMR